jgi:hypothetical protein
MDAQDQERLEEFINALRPRVRETVALCRSRSTYLDGLAISYKGMVEHDLRKKAYKPPSMVARELKTLARTMLELQGRFERLSKPSYEWIGHRVRWGWTEESIELWERGRGSQWFWILPLQKPGVLGSPLVDLELAPPPWRDLSALAAFLMSTEDPEKIFIWSTPELLVRQVSHAVKALGRPKAHVLPIAGAIHEWASGETTSGEWGKTYLKHSWEVACTGRW